MNDISLRKALHFGVFNFFNNIWFFIKAFLITIGIAALGFFSACFAAALFMLPSYKVFFEVYYKQIPKDFSLKETLVLDYVGNYFVQAKYYFLKFAKIFDNNFYFIFFLFGVIIFLVVVLLCVAIIKIGYTKIYLDFYNDGKSDLNRFSLCQPSMFKVFFADLIRSVFFLFFHVLIGYGVARIIYPVGTLVKDFSSLFFYLSFFSYMLINLKLLFVDYFIIDAKVGVLESFRRSFYISGLSQSLLYLILLISLASIISGAVGIIIYMPLTLAVTFYYKKLRTMFV